jgi:uncharacterized small protein (DUF1192 family)
LTLKQDSLIAQWMQREKTAVDYARTRDKRIAELEADVARLHGERRGHDAAKSSTALLEEQQKTSAEVVHDKRIAKLEADVARLHGELRGQDAAESSKALLERQQKTTAAVVHDLTVEIEQLRTQLARDRALHKAPPPSANANSSHLSKLAIVADMARAGLAEELRIQKQPEPTLQESILISDGEDLISIRWLPLKRALQSLQVIARLEPKRARR